MSWGSKSFGSGTWGGGSFASAALLVLAGVLTTGSVGSVGPNITIALTGNAATGSVGSVTNSRSKNITGNTGTGLVGSVTNSRSKAITGNTGTGSVGTVTPLSSLTFALTQVSAIGSVGSVTVSEVESIALTGNTGTGSVGTVTAKNTQTLTGNTATSSVGYVSIPPVTLVLTGVSAVGGYGAPAIFGGLSGYGPIISGPDGNLWIAEKYSDTIGRLTPNGVTTEFTYGISSGASILGICADQSGNLWFTENGYYQMGRITTAGVVTEFTTGINNYPRKCCLGPDGNVWFTENGHVCKITPAGVVTEYPVTTQPSALCVGGDGNLWYTPNDGSLVIGKITTGGTVTEYSTGITSAPEPYSLCLGPDGNVWFGEYSADKIGKITTAGVVTEYDVSPGNGPQDICLGPDGNLWFTNNSGWPTFGKITPDGAVTIYVFPESVGDVSGITTGPDGNIWISGDYGSNDVYRIPTKIVGTVSSSITVALTGNIATGSIGLVYPNGSWITGVTGVGSVGTVTPSSTNSTIPLTGVSADGSVGNVSPSIGSVTPSIVSVGGNYYTYGDTLTPTVYNGPNTLSFDATGCNYLVVLVSGSYTYPDPIFTGITFNGVALTQRASININDSWNPESEIWTLAAPASGVHDLVTTWTGYAAWGLDITAIGLKNVTAIDDVSTTSFVLNVDRTATVNSTAYDLCLAVLTQAYETIVNYAGQNEPGAHTDDGNFLRQRVASKQGVGSSTTLGWTGRNTGSATTAGISLTGIGPAQSTVALTQVAATGSVGTITAICQVNGSAALTGVSATSSVGTVTPKIETALTGNAATGSVGSVVAYNAISIAITSVSATGSVGNINASNAISIALTGISGTGSIGSVIASNSLSIALTGVSGTGSVGNVQFGKGFNLTGVSGTGFVGNVVQSLESGEGASSITGIEVVCFPGFVTLNIEIALTGNAATGSIGSLTPQRSFGLVGNTATGSIGNVTAMGESTAALTGNGVIGSIGNASTNITLVLSGVNAVSSIGSLGIGASLIGISATSQIGYTPPSTNIPIQGNMATGHVRSVIIPMIVIAGEWQRGSGHKFRNEGV